MSKRVSRNMLLVMLFGIISGICYRNLSLHKYFSLELFEAIGIIFVKVIKGIVPFLIFFSIASSVLSITDMRKARKMLRLSFISFVGLTLFAICIGIFVVSVVKPGVSLDKTLLSSSAVNAKLASHLKISNTSEEMSAIEFLVDLFPGNLMQDFVDGNFLHIIFFAAMCGYAILKLGKGQENTGKSIKQIEQIMIKVTELIMKTSPVVIFCLSFWLTGSQDLQIIKGLGKVILCVMLSGILLVYGGYSVISIFILKLNPIPFFKKILPCQIAGAVFASTSSVLPLTMNTCKKKIGISEQKTDFVIPLGATVNMNGSAIYYVTIVLFTVQIFNIPFGTIEILKLSLFSLIMAVGTAPVPGGALIFLSAILVNLHLPLNVVTMIVAIDRVLDSFRTFINISGDAFSALIVDKLDSTLNISEYNSIAHDNEDDV